MVLQAFVLGLKGFIEFGRCFGRLKLLCTYTVYIDVCRKTHIHMYMYIYIYLSIFLKSGFENLDGVA